MSEWTAQHRATVQAAYAKMTPGPWVQGVGMFSCNDDHGGESHGKGKCRYLFRGYAPRDNEITRSGLIELESVAEDEQRVAGNYDYEQGGIINAEDAAGIVALVNAYPLMEAALTEVLEALRGALNCIRPTTLVPEDRTFVQNARAVLAKYALPTKQKQTEPKGHHADCCCNCHMQTPIKRNGCELC